MKKILILLSVAAGMSAFAEMGLVPINQLIKRGKTNAMLVARNAKIVDITRVAGYMAGKQMGENAPVAPVYAEGYFPVYRNDGNNTGLGYELQAWSEELQKTISANIFFYEQGNDLYVYLYQFKIRGNAVAEYSLYSAGSYYEPSTSIDGENPCLCGLRVWLAGRDRVANWGFLGSSERMLWGGVSLTELVDFSGVFSHLSVPLHISNCTVLHFLTSQYRSFDPAVHIYPHIVFLPLKLERTHHHVELYHILDRLPLLSYYLLPFRPCSCGPWPHVCPQPSEF